MVKGWLNAIWVGALPIFGRATDMKGGFKYSTRNSLKHSKLDALSNRKNNESYLNSIYQIHSLENKEEK